MSGRYAKQTLFPGIGGRGAKKVRQQLSSNYWLQQKVNSTVEIEGLVADVNYTNIEKLVQGASLVLDGLDNLETSFLINDDQPQVLPYKYESGTLNTVGIAGLGAAIKFLFQEEVAKETVNITLRPFGRQFEVVTNIRRADVSENKDWVVLELEGEERDIEQGIDWVSNKEVRVDPVTGDIVEG